MGDVITFEPDGSNHIKRLSYDPDTNHLHVAFLNGSSESRSGVPAHVFAEMTRQRSTGKYYHAVIKRHYKLAEKSGKT